MAPTQTTPFAAHRDVPPDANSQQVITAVQQTAKSMAVKDTPRREPAIPCGMLPRRMRVLYITTYHRTGGWLAEALAADSAADVVLEEAVGVPVGLARLRDEIFDCVLVSHEPGELDALDLLAVLRTGGSEEPILVLGAQSEQELTALAYEVGADAYLCVNTTTTRTLLWTVARAMERHRLLRDNHRLAQADRHRLHMEHHEAERLLEQQRALIHDLEALGRTTTAVDAKNNAATNGTTAELAAGVLPEPAEAETIPLPPRLVDHYGQLLRAYVIMGSGNLSVEMSALAELLVTAGVSASQTVHMHLSVLEDLVRGLGSRSTRHVLNRADLLALEIMVHLAEGYRKLYQERQRPPQQQLLPGFEPAVE